MQFYMYMLIAIPCFYLYTFTSVIPYFCLYTFMSVCINTYYKLLKKYLRERRVRIYFCFAIVFVYIGRLVLFLYIARKIVLELGFELCTTKF